jgi:hypothetical protein
MDTNKLSGTPGRSSAMNANYEVKTEKTNPDMPLFGSPWMALFFVLRRELTQPRPEK